MNDNEYGSAVESVKHMYEMYEMYEMSVLSIYVVDDCLFCRLFVLLSKTCSCPPFFVVFVFGERESQEVIVPKL